MKKLISIIILTFVSIAGFAESGKHTISERINNAFEPIVDVLGAFLFWDPVKALGFDIGTDVPLVVVWLIVGATFFTIRMKFINFRKIGHAIGLIRGKYDNPEDAGEVTHFQALATALSATVGLGNIAGVAIAITLGGPGATFWMIIAGLLGMTSKFVEVTLGVKYREIDAEGRVSGGPMYYLNKALSKRNLGWLGKILAVVFAVLVIGGSFGGGNMFQANQSFSQLSAIFPNITQQQHGALYGLMMAILVGVVIIGGIKSIASVTEKIVPIMAVIYILASLIIIGMNIESTGEAFGLILKGAFTANAMKGGLIGVLIVGFQRAAFSNEAGVGSASIAHSAVKTEEPVSEGIVALLEPFIDTVVICTMTALVLIFTGFYENPTGLEGAQLTSAAYGSVISFFPFVLTVAIFLFAFSTMISWSYYGQKGFNYLFGKYFEKIFGNRKVMRYTFQVIFLIFIIIGASSSLNSVMDFSDMMILSMAFPNIIGLVILSKEVSTDLKSYFQRLKSGEIKKFK